MSIDDVSEYNYLYGEGPEDVEDEPDFWGSELTWDDEDIFYYGDGPEDEDEDDLYAWGAVNECYS